MARISCEPCEIVFPACDCCHEILCVCDKNKVIQCDDPCFSLDESHFPGGAPLPFFIEGMVPDVNLLDNHAVIGPPLSAISISGWDTNRNFFNYQFITDASTYLSSPGSYTDDLSTCRAANNALVTNRLFRNNENLKAEINSVIYSLLSKSALGYGGYIPCGVGVPSPPTAQSPYNEIDYFLTKDNSLVRRSISDNIINTLNLLNRKTVTSYNFSAKYIKAMRKSIVFGYFDTYFQNGKLDSIRRFSESSYRNKAVPSLVTVSSSLRESGTQTTSSINLENAKTYINENRIRFNTTQAGQRLTNKVLRQYWKFVPSDINLRVRVYVDQAGSSIYNDEGHVIAGSGTPSEHTIRSIKINDDDTVSVHRAAPNTGKARAHYINAEHLRVFNNSGAHVYLDEVPRYQTGCGCCTSGCFMSLCSNRNSAYVFDTMDRSVLLGLLGAVSGFVPSGTDAEPSIKLSVSAPFTSELEFDAGIQTEGSALKDFYLLTPDLSGTDTLSGIADVSSPYVQKTTLRYKIAATTYSAATQKAIDRAVRYKAGPGNVLYLSNEDPIFYYLNYIDKNDLSLSAEVVDLNIDGLINGSELYPRRIPAHILVVPSDQPVKNPFYGKSLITKMEDASESDGVVRTIKMLPAPTQNELASNYLRIIEEEEDPLTYTKGESDKLPFGPQGTSTKPLRMLFTASDIYGSFNNWRAGEEVDRRIDPVRKVFDFLSNVSSNYDTRTDVTYSAGYNTVQLVGNPVYPVNNSRSLPLFDVWRHLSQYEFHEFVYSFNDTLFQKLMDSKYRGLQLFYMLGVFPERTYLNKYDPLTSTWPADGVYGGTTENFRNASGVSFIEDSLFMDKPKVRDC